MPGSVAGNDKTTSNRVANSNRAEGLQEHSLVLFLSNHLAYLPFSRKKIRQFFCLFFFRKCVGVVPLCQPEEEEEARPKMAATTYKHSFLPIFVSKKINVHGQNWRNEAYAFHPFFHFFFLMSCMLRCIRLIPKSKGSRYASLCCRHTNLVIEWKKQTA